MRITENPTTDELKIKRRTVSTEMPREYLRGLQEIASSRGYLVPEIIEKVMIEWVIEHVHELPVKYIGMKPGD